MTFKERAQAWARKTVPQFLGANISTYNWFHHSFELSHNMLGGISYSGPEEGTILAVEDGMVLMKLSAKKFSVIREEDINAEACIGDKVKITYYEPRRVDGTLADGSEDPRDSSGVRRMMLTGVKVYLPFTFEGRYQSLEDSIPKQEIKSPFLIDLVKQLEEMTVNNGFRTVAGAIADAKARSFKLVDTVDDEEIIAKPPTLQFCVINGKFCGTVKIEYDRAMDYYKVTFDQGSAASLEVIEDVNAFDLGELLVSRIDDESWKRFKLEVLKKAPKKRKVAA